MVGYSSHMQAMSSTFSLDMKRFDSREFFKLRYTTNNMIGGCSDVRLAQANKYGELFDLEAGTFVIIKRLNETTKRALIVNEISLLHKLSDCRYVSRILGEFQDSKDNSFKLILQAVPGQDLLGFLMQQKTYIKHDMWISLCREIATAVKALHSMNIFHRDLKPENIMIYMDNEASRILSLRLIDFGLACSGDEAFYAFETEAYAHLGGTEVYTDPQLFRNIAEAKTKSEKNQIFKASDVWALGQIFVTALFRFNLYDQSRRSFRKLSVQEFDHISHTSVEFAKLLYSLTDAAIDWRLRPTIDDILTTLSSCQCQLIIPSMKKQLHF